eukprot:g83386.t1
MRVRGLCAALLLAVLCLCLLQLPQVRSAAQAAESVVKKKERADPDTLHRQAQEAIRAGHVTSLIAPYERASRLLRRIIKYYPEYPPLRDGHVHMLLGDCYQAVGHGDSFHKALQAYNASLLRLDGQGGVNTWTDLQRQFAPALLYNVALLHHAQRHWERALVFAERLVQIAPQDFGAQMLRGLLMVHDTRDATGLPGIDVQLAALEQLRLSAPSSKTAKTAEMAGHLTQLAQHRHALARTLELMVYPGKPIEELPAKYHVDSQFDLAIQDALHSFQIIMALQGAALKEPAVVKWKEQAVLPLGSLQSVQKIVIDALGNVKLQKSAVVDTQGNVKPATTENEPPEVYGELYPRNFAQDGKCEYAKYLWPFTLQYTERHSVLLTLRDVLVVGDDGIVVDAYGRVYSDAFGSQRAHTTLAQVASLDPAAFLNTQGNALACAVSLVSPFAGTYFQWLTAAVPRLLMLLPFLKKRPECQLLVPVTLIASSSNGPQAPSFVRGVMELLKTEAEDSSGLPALDLTQRAVTYTITPTTTVSQPQPLVVPVRELLVIDWERHPQDGLSEYRLSHLPPRALLQATRHHLTT